MQRKQVKPSVEWDKWFSGRDILQAFALRLEEIVPEFDELCKIQVKSCN